MGAPSFAARRAILPNRVALETRFIPHHLDSAFPISCSAWGLSDEPIRALDRHDVLELGLCLEGTGSYLVEDKVMNYERGSVVVVNDVESHFSQSAPGTTSRWATIFLRPESLIGGIDPDRRVLSTKELCGDQFQNVLAAQDHPELAGLMEALVEEVSRPRPEKEAAIKGLVWTLMACLHRLPGKSPVAASKLTTLATVAPALDRIKAGHADKITLPELASLCGMSPRTFTRYFHEALNDAPMRFLNRYRIARACEQLANSRASVLDISLAVGFDSLAAFNRHFRAVTQRTPREWRRSRSG